MSARCLWLLLEFERTDLVCARKIVDSRKVYLLKSFTNDRFVIVCWLEIPYEVVVYTGDVRGAGTDANVMLVLYGEKGKSEEFSLRNKSDNFERNQVDKFKVRENVCLVNYRPNLDVCCCCCGGGGDCVIVLAVR